jgi:hypothetical protein
MEMALSKSKEDILRIIEGAAARHGVDPKLMQRIAETESSFNPQAVGPETKYGRAKGLFQFIDDTAKGYQLDDPHDPEKASDAAARFLKDLHKRYAGNTDAMLAHYNGGTAVARQVIDGKPINAQTYGYLAKINGAAYQGGTFEPDHKYAKAAQGLPVRQQGADLVPGREVIPVPKVESTAAGSAAPLSRNIHQEEQNRRRESPEPTVLDTLGSVPSLAMTAIRNDNSVYQWWNRVTDIADPDFEMTDEIAKEVLAGIPSGQHQYILEGRTSMANLQTRRQRVIEALERDREMARHGGLGIGIRFATGLLDVATLVELALPFGVIRQATRLGNAARAGAMGATAGIVGEEIRNAHRPMADPDDTYMAALFGLSIGGGIGGLLNPAKLRSGKPALPRHILEDQAYRMAELGHIEGTAARINALIDNTRIHDPGWLAQTRSALAAMSDIKLRQVVTRAAMDDPKMAKAVEERGIDGLVSELRVRGLPDDDAYVGILGVSSATLDTAKLSKNPVYANRQQASVAEQAATDSFGLFHTGLKFDDAGKLIVKGYERESVAKLAAALDLLGHRSEKQINALRTELKANRKALAVGLVPNSTAKAELRKLLKLKDVNLDPTIVPLAKRLLHAMEEAGMSDIPVVRDVHPLAVAKGADGTYNVLTNQVVTRKGSSPNTMLHEIAHGLTVAKLRHAEVEKGSKWKPIRDELEAIRLAAQKAYKEANPKSDPAKGGTPYYLTNDREFVAGLYSGHKDFYNFLANRAYKGPKSALSRAWDLVKDLLGFSTKEMNEFRRALDLVDEMITSPTEMKVIKHRLHGESWTDTYSLHPTADPFPAVPLVANQPGIPHANVVAANRAGLNEVFGIGLGLENQLGRSTTQAVRDEAAKLFGTTVGYKDHSVVKANAWDDTVMMAEGWTATVKKEYAPAFEDWMKATGKKWLERGPAQEEFGELVTNYIRGIKGEYPKEVHRAGDAIRKQLAEVVEHINNPGLKRGQQKRGLTQREYRDPETGEKKLTDPLEKNPNYIPRKHDVVKWNHAVSTFGREAVETFFANAWKRANPESYVDGKLVETTDDMARKWAKWYAHNVQNAKLNADHKMGEMLDGKDLTGLKMSLMEHGIDEDEAAAIVRAMFPTKPVDGNVLNGNLRRRSFLDESYSEKVKLADGREVDLTINDFTDTNAMSVVEHYFRRQAGAIALADHLGVYKLGDIDQRIREATKSEFGDGKARANVQRDENQLRFAYNHILGVPHEDLTPTRKLLEMFRHMNVIRLMGGAVWNQIVELGNVIGTMGMKTTLEAIPELKKFKRDLKSGKAPNDILDHIENVTGGAGAELVQRMEFKGSDDWVRMKGDTKFARFMDKTDNVLRRGALNTLKYTGMTGAMVQQKRVHAIALVNHFANVANHSALSAAGRTTKTDMGFLTPSRLAVMGLDEQGFKAVLAGLKRNATMENGKVKKINWDAWAKEDPESHSAFTTAIHRESRRVIQENDLASMIPIMGTTLGKTTFQFMNFVFHAWNKQMMFAAHHRDVHSLASITWGSTIAMAVYFGRTHARASGLHEDDREEFLAEQLTPQKIVLGGGLGRIGQASVLPQAIDTFLPFGPYFEGTRATSDVSGIASLPTVGLANSLSSLIKGGFESATSSEKQVTNQDVRAWMKLLPLNNAIGVQTILNRIASEFPSSNSQDD